MTKQSLKCLVRFPIIALIVLITSILAVQLHIPVAHADSRAQMFVHRVNSSNNTIANSTSLDEINLDSNDSYATRPGDFLFVTPNWNPGNRGGTYDSHPLSVWRDIFGNWYINHEDNTPIPIGAFYNVRDVAAESTSAFAWHATPSNSTYDYTIIDNPLTNNNPNAVLLVTQVSYVENVSGHYGTTNNHNVGVWYNASIGKWTIFNEDLTSIPRGAVFNVQVLESNFLTWQTTAVNSSGDFTNIDYPTTNNDPGQIVVVTPNWQGVYNNHPIGVWYNSSVRKWSIFNEDQTAIPYGTIFNIQTGGCYIC